MRYKISFLLFIVQLAGVCSALPSVFPPDNYAGGCFGMLRYTYLWAPCEGVTGRKLAACLCKLPEVIETSVSCIDQLMANVTSKTREPLRRSVYKALLDQCKAANLSLSTLEFYQNRSSSLQPYDKPQPKALAGSWNATKAFKPSSWECRKSVVAYYGSSEKVPRGLRTCAAMLAYWGGVLLIRFIFHWVSKVLPKSKQATNTRLAKICRRLLSVPALITNRHSEAVCVTRHFPLNLPTREQSIIIAGFVVLHLGLTFGYNPYYPDSYIYRYDNVCLYNQNLAFRTGKMAVFELPLAILFAGRNNFLQWLTGWSHDTFVVYHKWVARSIGFSILTHSATYTVARMRRGLYAHMWTVGYWKWGVAGAVGCCVIIFQGMAAIRRLNYEVFLILHIVLALLFIIGGFYHLKLMNEELQYFYATFAVWGFDRAFRLFRVLVNNPLATADVQLCGDDMLELTVSYSEYWKPRPGDYAFIHVVQPSFFWESHPFTLSLGVRPGEENRLKVFCRVKDGMTRRTALKAARSGGSFKTGVWIDGPYGPSYNLKQFDEVLLVAGGIGVTAPFSYIHGLLQDSRSRVSKIALFWAVRDDTALDWFKDQLEYLRQSGRVEVNIQISRGRQDPDLERENFDTERGNAEPTASANQEYLEPMSSGSNSDNEKTLKQSACVSSSSTLTNGGMFRVSNEGLNTRNVVRTAIEESRGSLGVLCCGPGRMNDDCRYAVAHGLSLSPNFVEYFEESFSW